MQKAGHGALTSLSQLGVALNRDGSLSLTSEETLRASVRGGTEDVQTILGAVGQRLTDLVTSYSKTGGILAQHQSSAQKQSQLLDARITRSNSDLKRKQGQLMGQLGKLQASLTLLSQQQQYMSDLLTSTDALVSGTGSSG